MLYDHGSYLTVKLINTLLLVLFLAITVNQCNRSSELSLAFRRNYSKVAYFCVWGHYRLFQGTGGVVSVSTLCPETFPALLTPTSRVTIHSSTAMRGGFEHGCFTRVQHLRCHPSIAHSSWWSRYRLIHNTVDAYFRRLTLSNLN